jgi:hypothetical protein
MTITSPPSTTNFMHRRISPLHDHCLHPMKCLEEQNPAWLRVGGDVILDEKMQTTLLKAMMCWFVPIETTFPSRKAAPLYDNPKTCPLASDAFDFAQGTRGRCSGSIWIHKSIVT